MYDDVSHGDWQWLSVAAAAAMLGLSPSTIRRRIKDGAAIAVPGHGEMVLQGEREERPQGSVFLVRLPKSLAPPLPREAQVDASGEHDAGVSEAPAHPLAEELIAGLSVTLQAPWQELTDRLLAERNELAERLLVTTVEADRWKRLVTESNKVAAEAIACRDQWRDRAMAAEVTTLAVNERAQAIILERDEWMREARGWQQVAEESQAEYGAVLRAQAELLAERESEASGRVPERVLERILRWLGALNPL